MADEEKKSKPVASEEKTSDSNVNDGENASLFPESEDVPGSKQKVFGNANYVFRKAHALVIISAFAAITIVATVIKMNNVVPLSKLNEQRIPMSALPEFDLAKGHSYGLFDNISNREWEVMRENVKNHDNHLYFGRTKNMHLPHLWHSQNFEPDFFCPNTVRVGNSGGGVGNGVEYMCNPHRVAAQIRERKARGGNGCLIYSVGNGRRFDFEKDIQNAINEPCEIHSFDRHDYSENAPPNVHVHPWAISNSGHNLIRQMKDKYKSLQETIDILGHRDHVIDVFRADCESCEWSTFRDWMDADVTLMQVLVQVHDAPRVAIKFFETFQNNGYVTFHKEKYLKESNTVEYSMLKLTPEFFV